MVVQIQRKGRSITGLNIGSGNVRRYFPKSQSSVDLQLGHLLIRCKLRADFWGEEPSISDPRLSLWLEAKSTDEKAQQARTEMSLVPAEDKSFRLEFKEKARTEASDRLDAA